MVRVLGWGASLVAVLMTMVWLLQRQLTYFPAGQPPPIEGVLPGGEEVTFTTEDGLELDAWWLAAPTTRPPRDGNVAVIVLPGNGGNRAGRADLAVGLAERGLSVLLVDYRGFGGNPGRPSEEGLGRDARAAARWVRDLPAVDTIVYFGESLGAAVAVRLAVELPPDGLVLRSPFTSLTDVARAHFGPVPRFLLRDRYPSLDLVGEVSVPMLVIVAGQDEVVPVNQSRRLAEEGGARYLEIEGAGHNDPVMFDGDEVLGAVEAFVRELP